jgi:flagellar biosynthetic protein FlhB
VVLLAFGIAGNLVQHMPVLSVEPITPKLSKISPIEGAKRLFSVEALVNFAKGLIKLAVVGRRAVVRAAAGHQPAEEMISADPGDDPR